MSRIERGQRKTVCYCEPAFKEQWKGHRNCHKTKQPWLFKGKQLNAYMKLDLLEAEKEYRICGNIAPTIMKSWLKWKRRGGQQSTIRTAHVSYAIRERRAVASTTKNMRELQSVFQLIVDLGDQASKIEKVKERFVWMGEVADHLKYDHLGMFLRLEDGSLFKVLEVRKSGIEGSGLGLFAACDFSKEEIVTIFVGKEIEKTVSSIFSISNTFVTLDAAPWCAENMNETYLAAHMANDPNWMEEGGDGGDAKKIETNVDSFSKFEVIANKAIKAGDEIKLDYRLTTNYN